MNYKTTQAGLGLVLSLLTTTIHAETWQVGIVAETARSPFAGDSKETNALPELTYEGDRFSYLGGKLQYNLGSFDGGDTYLLGQMRQRQYYSAGLDLDDDLGLDGMEDRESAFELGLGWENRATWGKLVSEGAFDVTGAHEGFELTASYSYPKQSGRWMIEPAIGIQLQSSELVDYYHGVRDSEVRDGRPAYEGDRAVNSLVSLTVGYSINTQLLAVAGVGKLVLDSNITDSPIVDEENVRKVGLGLIYTF